MQTNDFNGRHVTMALSKYLSKIFYFLFLLARFKLVASKASNMKNASLALLLQFFALLSLASAFNSTDFSKLNVSIYLESYCQFSRQFMQKQLKPAYGKIKSLVNIKFIPFGGSEVGKWGSLKVDWRIFSLPELFDTWRRNRV